MSNEAKNGGALSALQKIKETEEEAEKIIRNAREKDAQQNIQEAFTESKKIKEDILANARKQAEKVKSEIINKADDEAGEIRKQAGFEERELRETAEKNMPFAVKKTAEKIKSLLKEGWQ